MYIISQLLIKLLSASSIVFWTLGCSFATHPLPLPLCIYCSGKHGWSFPGDNKQPPPTPEPHAILWETLRDALIILSISKNSSREKWFIVLDSPVSKVWKMLQTVCLNTDTGENVPWYHDVKGKSTERMFHWVRNKCGLSPICLLSITLLLRRPLQTLSRPYRDGMGLLIERDKNKVSSYK